MTKTNPLLIVILALGVFGIITTEMGIIGVLPQVVQKFHITTSAAGILVSIFALVVALSGPFITLLSSGINRKFILLISVLMFAVSNVVYIFTMSFNVMVVFRIIPALAHSAFFSVALVVAASLVSPEKSSQAVTKVFTGITAGFAFGVPLTSYLAERISVEVAFMFGAIISIIAFFGILIWLPSMPVKEKMTYGQQLSVLRKPALWLNIASVICLFAAMFSVYSYFAEYLGQVTQVNGSWISIMLFVFGLVMILGNFIFGAFVQKNIALTATLFPLILLLIYMMLYFLGIHFIPMFVLIFLWGIVHAGGLIIGQSWLIIESQSAPEFGNSLFITFANLGITIGTTIGGWFLLQWDVRQLVWSGIGFTVLAFLLIIIRIKVYGKPLAQKLNLHP
ncbi:MFS transporter [Paenibacillus sp. FSL H7-0331]|uniref:MFS transporter n=1 Tax=Paenibacillus sp. FSL H7-0331 TaxID=1920421 RepID=UPI00096E64B4|nr:MFS transporter [Paenibacillus sp. FSL H7-0331]OME97806.1 arabinose ABC transporter permease [Paenibacillus sp. FSL H7-0331]